MGVHTLRVGAIALRVGAAGDEQALSQRLEEWGQALSAAAGGGAPPADEQGEEEEEKATPAEGGDAAAADVPNSVLGPHADQHLAAAATPKVVASASASPSCCAY